MKCCGVSFRIIDSSMLGRSPIADVRSLRAVEHVIEQGERDARISVGLIRDGEDDSVGDAFLR